MKLLAVDEARGRMLAAVTTLSSEAVYLSMAFGRVLAADVVATRDQPPFAASAMDGWGVRAADGAGWRKIVGESAAGHGFAGELKPGEAVRVSTGAAVPAGADAVVIQEEAHVEGGRVFIPSVTLPHHIRKVGGDFRAGDVLLAAGARLDAWRLSLAAAAGQATVAVARQPVVAILSTGEEVVAPGAIPGPFQIFDSGTTALAALVAVWGGKTLPLRPVGDNASAIAEAVAGVACDLLVTVGGASVGDHDLVKPALARLGLELSVESVALRPGKPTWFGTLAGGRLVLGLPGNPASALVCAELFLRPLLRVLQGARAEIPTIRVKAANAIAANSGREQWLRARLINAVDEGLLVEPFANQDSSLVSVFADADVLVQRPAGAPGVAPGEPVTALVLERLV